MVSNSLWPHEPQHTCLPCPSPSPGGCSNSCPLSPWCHPNISSSVVPFSFHLQSFPASVSLPMSQLCISGGQSIGASASASFLEGAFLCMCVYMLCMCGQEGLLTLRMKNMWSGRFAYPPPFFGLLWCCGWEPACQCRRCERCELDTWVGRSPGGGHGNPLQYSCLENHMDKAWWTTFWSWTVLWRHTRSSKANTDKRYLFHYRGLECKIGN